MSSDTTGDIERLHALLLQLLVAFRDVCEKADIGYCLSFGTLLGAVREGGFIPWDTDVDVEIMLPDKQRFRDAFERYKPDGIMLKNHDATDKCLQSHDSLLFEDKQEFDDVHLDIYPWVGAPAGELSRRLFAKYTSYADRIIRSKYVSLKDCRRKYAPLVLGAKVIDRLIPDAVLRKNIHNRERKYEFESAPYRTVLCSYGNPESCLPREIWSELVPCMFEGERFMIPVGWEEYLTCCYGRDFMIPKVY